MAKKSGQPPSCNLDVYSRGIVIATVDAWKSAWELEQWCRDIAEQSWQRVDWHYIDSKGLAFVKVLGDAEAAQEKAKAIPVPDGVRVKMWPNLATAS